ncbi:hypothetical protein [Streptomyces sp. NPDC021224]|uniref:hypothetical protein n=1 Tax=unclassified Streptomyces TaxID=2593676 RepID=UPI0037AF4603
MHLLGRYYRQAEAGRPQDDRSAGGPPNKRAINADDTIVFRDRDTGRELDVTVKRIAPYPSFEELLSSEDPARIDPDQTRITSALDGQVMSPLREC